MTDETRTDETRTDAPEDIRALLGLDDDLPPDRGGPPEPAEGAAGPIGAAPPPAPPPPHALRLDAWGARKGHDLVAEGGALAGAGATPEAAADFHALAFEPCPELADACEDALRHEYVRDVLQTPDWRELNASTALDVDASELAACHFAKGYAALAEARAEAGAEVGSGPRAESKRRLQAMRAASAAARAAREEVEAAAEAAEALGLGPGPDGARIDPRRAAEAYRKIRADPALQKIVRMAGVFRRVAQSRRRNRARHGRDEVVGVELGGDLARLLPSELAALASGDEDLELDALRRLAERQALQHEVRSSEPVGRGPVVVVVDESGSMRGEKIEAAKGLALAVAWVARKQGRWAALVGFSGGTEGTLCVLPPGRWDEAALLDWLAHFYGGGTTLDVPIRELPFAYWPRLLEAGAARGKTDIIIITDAIVHAPAEDVSRFNAWRRAERARVEALVVDGEPGDLALVADACYRVRSLGPDDGPVSGVLDL
jgi:uncharacterized protein with von Willebrand factor type A (vWA) domain